MPQEMIQYLNPEGEILNDDYHKILDDDQHRTLFSAMLKVRVCEERFMNLQRQGRIGFYIGAYGQEASHCATAFAFKNSDWVFPSYRELGVLFLRQVSMTDIVNQLYGNAADNTQGAQMPCHYAFRDKNFVSISSPIATQWPQAAGAAMAAKYRKTGDVTFSYIGDGGTSEGDFHVGCNFAAVYNAPVVFIVENNQWAISCPASEQSKSETYAIKAKAYGFDGVLVDGNDPLALYHVTKEAADKARNGGGPTLIESKTYRLFSHSSSDDHGRYHDKEAYEAALKNEPLIRYRKYLTDRKVWNQGWEDEIAAATRDELSTAIKEAEKIGRPEPRTLFENVYDESTMQLEEQWMQLKEEMAERERLNIKGEAEGAFPL